MASGRERALLALRVLVWGGVVLVAGFFAYFAFRGDAYDKAKAMCDATPIGSSADEAFERAQQADPPYSGLRWEERQDGELELVVMFPDDDPRSGSSCVISARDGKVTRTGIGTYIFD